MDYNKNFNAQDQVNIIKIDHSQQAQSMVLVTK